MKKFGRYEVVRRLGGGSEGDVFLAYDPAFGREVAIKAFAAVVPDEDRSRQPFEQEVAVVSDKDQSRQPFEQEVTVVSDKDQSRQPFEQEAAVVSDKDQSRQPFEQEAAVVSDKDQSRQPFEEEAAVVSDKDQSRQPFEQEVAVVSEKDQWWQRFNREMRVMASLSHPAIVPIYDFGEQDGQLFLVMRFMDGGSLRDRLKQQGTFSVQEVSDLLERLAPALEMAHAQGMIHCSLRPGKILLDTFDHPSIVDFGLAKLLNISILTKTGKFLDAAHYISPEQARGERDIDHRTDIYALGVIVFELLTGKWPYESDNALGFGYLHNFEAIPNICQINPNLPAECQPIIERALAKKPEDRYNSASEFAEALKTLIADDKDDKEDTQDAVDLWMQGLEFYKQKLYPQAIAQYTEAVRKDASYAPAYFSRGQAYYQTAEYALAIADYNNTLRVEPNYTAVYYWRGRANRQMGQFEQAISDYGEALRLNPNYAAAYFQRGLAFQEQGHLDLAISDYDAALRLNPKHVKAQTQREAVEYVKRGHEFYDQKDYDLAIAEYTKALHKKADYSDAYLIRGNAYYWKGEYGLAIADYDQTLRLTPDYVAAYYWRGNAYRQRREFEQAISDYSKALQLKYGYAAAYFQRGVAYQELGNLDRAIADYDTALRLDPNHTEAENNRRVAYEALIENDSLLVEQVLIPYELNSLHEVSYEISLSFLAERLFIGDELEATIELRPVGLAENADYLLNIPINEVEGGELNLILEASGFQFLEESAASLPFIEPSRDSTPQRATFHLIALRPGTHQISVELYRGGEYEGEIKQTVQVAGVEENVTLSRPLALSPRPVAQPDYVLQVQTRWDEGGSVCSFHYHLTSTHASLLLTGGVRAQSKSVSRVQVERLRDSWQLLLGQMAGGVAMEVRSRLAALGRYLYETLLPDTLRQELRMLGGVRRVAESKRRTLLLVADEDACLPWELLYDRGKFLAERVIMGRWLRELGDVPPYEFPVGQVRVAYYERVREQHEWWVGLIEPPGSPRAHALPDGVLDNPNPVETEALRGLHLLRYGEKMGAGEWDAPVLLADAQKEETIKGQVQPIKLDLYRNHPLVSLSYVTSGRPELTNLIEEWAPTFVRAGCSAFVGPLWTVSPAVEAAFISGFYHHLWTGGSLGEAFEAGRQLARAVNPESLDWLAYVLFGDPMARPYRPVKGTGYAVVEPIGQSIDEPLRASVRTRFRVGLRRTPPVWLKERVIEVEEALELKEPRVHLVAFDLPVEPKGAIELVRTAQGEYLGWFSVLVPPDMVDEVVELQVHFADGRKRIQSVMLSFDVIDGKREEGS